MKARLPLPDLSALTPEQARIADSIMESRGSIAGPFLAWMHVPELADKAQQLGAYCRLRTSLSLQESELLILVVAAHHECLGEQQIHEPIAREAGLDATVIIQLREHLTPTLSTARLNALYRMATELLSTNRLRPAVRDELVQVLGVAAVVDSVAVVGYYCMVAHTLNAFEMHA